jgi:hypothetical protein
MYCPFKVGTIQEKDNLKFFQPSTIIYLEITFGSFGRYMKVDNEEIRSTFEEHIQYCMNLYSISQFVHCK